MPARLPLSPSARLTHSSSVDGWQLEVTGQKGCAFHGDRCGSNQCETVVGPVRRNGELLMADEEGISLGTLEGGVLDLCYVEPSTDFQVASCLALKLK